MKTIVSLVLDRSGSMSLVKSDVIGGYNEYIKGLKKQEGKLRFTLTQFNTEAEVVFTNRKIDEVPLLTDFNYLPSGGTALLDAVGRTISALRETEKDSKVLFVVMTDGEENSSRTYSTEAIKALIKEAESTGRWTFVFLAAGPNAWTQAGGLGIKTGNFMAYDPAQTRRAMHNLGTATLSYSASVAPTTADFWAGGKEEKEDETKKK